MRLNARSLAACLALSLAVAGCALPNASPTGTLKPPAGLGATAASNLVLTGRVMAPAGVVAAGGGNVVAAGGGNVVAAGGGNVVAAGGGNMAGRQVLALSETALVNTEVFLADEAGNPLPGVKPVKTDAKGQFKFKGMPDGYTFLVVARAKTADGKDATLQTMAHPGKAGTTADISAASTLVAAGMADGQGDLGEFNPAKFKTATDAAAKNLTAETLPDFSDRTKVLASFKALEGQVTELKSLVAELRAELKVVKGSLKTLKKRLADRVPVAGAPVAEAGEFPTLAPLNTCDVPVAEVKPDPADDLNMAENVTERDFSLSDAFPKEDYPLFVSFRVAGTPAVLARIRFAEPGAKATGKVPEGLGYELLVKTARMTERRMVPMPAPFLIAPGAAKDVALALPVDGTTTAPVPGTPTTPVTTAPGTTEPGATVPAGTLVDVTVLMPDVPEAIDPAAYPVTVEFAALDGTVVTTATFVGPLKRPMIKLPLSTPLNLTFVPTGDKQKVLYPNFKYGGADPTRRLPWPTGGTFVVQD